MATETASSCTGSSLLQPISEIINLPLDQVNFVVCQLFALLTALWFRLYLHPSKTSTFVRHVVATLLGFYLALFCFGWYALHFLVQSGLTYSIMIFAGVEHMHKYCFVVALGYLTFCQITRVYVFDYGMYSADFTGPMMVITQKITSLAFEIHDGMARKEELLTSSQKCLAVRYVPKEDAESAGVPELQLQLHGHPGGTHVLLQRLHRLHRGHRLPAEAPRVQRQGEREVQAVGPLAQEGRDPQAVHVCRLSARLPVRVQDVPRGAQHRGRLHRHHALPPAADAINNAAGFGFNGYNKDGTPRWDLISNLRILDIEFATSFKMFLDNWNIQTALWLKRVCYERCPYNPTAATFLLSAIWHGVYPGYYLTFFTGILMTMAARAIRHNVRPHFLGSAALELLYDVVTWAGTQIAICYTVVPFVLLAVGPSLKFYRSWYFCIHIVCVLLMVFLPVKPRHLRAKEVSSDPAALQAPSSPPDTESNCSQKRKAS
ncbi:membrane-bound O-acyltransferase domain-containing protein 2 isoform X2 [Scleropages formosus]|uniref:membrane-bound O-acyltransferase domain-containing protein 2 isoform X2 n=1 Tax=Scleropages formosus TaxID=113540 RepID=UPI0010FAC024|nr:membrane-bound O-acyltransferase domain-containing protein 2-like isoform X2 [Scleropages formosus]